MTINKNRLWVKKEKTYQKILHELTVGAKMIEDWQQYCLVTLRRTPLNERLEECAYDRTEAIVRYEAQVCQGGMDDVVCEVWMLVELKAKR